MLKTKYNTDKAELKNKIPDVSSFATEAQLNAVKNETPRASDFVTKNDLITIENKIPDISNLATKAALTAIENKIPSVGDLVKKKQTIILKLQKSKINLMIIIMINILILQSLIL